ncbi:MAG: choice-of-anchor J domain-containing protein, partial [Bacteroidales bacterium]|nr:choice-of-anchor J domain-containing protein [Bacteroidales bacterium]
LLDVNIVGGLYTGGFSGWLQNAQLERCFVTGSVEGKSGHTGSLIGIATEGSIIKNAYTSASLTGYTGTSAYGGLAGGIYGSSVTNSFASGIVSLPIGGGLIGYATESEVTGSFWDTESTQFSYSAGGIGKTTAEMNDITTFLNAGWDFKGLGAEGIWNIGNGRNNGYPYLSWQYPSDPVISIEVLPSAVITDVTNITQTSVTFNIDVTNIGNPQGTQLGVCWSSTNPEPTTSDDNELSSEPFALGNYTIGVGALDHSTTYYARAFATNASGTAYSEVFIFNTECGVLSLPLTENFDNSSEFPNCWNVFTVGGGSVLIYNFEPNSYPNHAWLFAQNIGNEAYLVLPELDADINTLSLQFMSKSGLISYGWPADMVLEIGTMTDPADASTFSYFTHIQTQDFYEQQIVSLATYSGADKYIAFRVSSNIQEQRGYVFIDDIEIDLIPSCPEPFNLYAEDITPYSATVGWTQIGNGTQWDLIYGLAGFNPNEGGTLIEGIDETFSSLVDLVPATYYQFYVRAHCGEETSEWSIPYTFNTECLAFPTPFAEDFDNTPHGDIPTCWTISGTYSDAYVQNWGDFHSAPNSFYIYKFGSHNTLLSAPPVAEPLSGLRVKFWAKIGGGDDQLKVGTVANPNDLGTFEEIQTVTLTNSWQEFTVYLNDYVGNNEYIAFWYGNGISWGEMFIDDVEIDLIPSCPEPFNLYAEDITPYSATVGWTQIGNGTQWDLIYGLAGFNPNEGGTLIEGIDETFSSLVDLVPATYYQFYVRAHCGEETSEWSIPYTFNTECLAFPTPFAEDFDNTPHGDIPTCWTISGTYSDAYVQNWGDFHSAPNSFYIYKFGSHNTLLSAPPVAEPLSGLRVKFWAKIGGGDDQLKVGTVANPNDLGTFEEIQTVTLTNSWQEFTVYLNDYVGNNEYIAFWYGNGISWGEMFIDDVEIDAIPSCPEPYITIGTITQTTAEVSWRAPGATQFEIAYGPKGFNPQSEGDIISGISSTTHTLTDLNHSTAYEVYIRSNCGAETSDWSYPAAFNTECGAIDLPFTQNFDNSTSLPLCWSVSGYNFFWVDITDHNRFSTPNSARLYHESSSYAILATPKIAGGLQNLRVRFKALLGDCPSIGNLYVGSMTDPTDASTFTPIKMFEVTNKPGDDWHSFEVWFDEYTGSDTHIAFRLGEVTSAEWARAFIDDIE